MKKTIVIIASCALLLAANAFAGDQGTTTQTQELRADQPSAASIAKASKNVMFGYYTASTGYSLTAFHSSGTKNYGSGSESTKIYFQVATAIIQPTDSSSEVAFTGWTAM